MALPNGRVHMSDFTSPPMLSPKTFSPTRGNPQSMTSSTFDNASLDELDRIMDTLSTLSREASLARGPNDAKKFALPSPPGSEQTGQRSHPTGPGSMSESTSPFSATSPTREFPVTSSVSMPPPMTSPPQTPVAQSPRHFSSHPKVMTMSAMPSHQPQNTSGLNEARNPATVPRLPSNPYENTSILHGSHMVRSNANSTRNSTPYPAPPDSPYVNKNTSPENQGQFFFGPLPVSPQQISPERYPPTGPKPPSMMPQTMSANNQNEVNAQQYRNNRDEFGAIRSQAGFINSVRSDINLPKTHESHTLPAYNEKRSYLKNLEEGTLPRPRVDSSKQASPRNATPNLGRKLSKPKPSLTEEAGEALNRLSLRRPSNKAPKRVPAKFGLQNLSKTPSRHSTTSFNSFELGRGYASVSTAPASTHGLIQHEILPHGRKKPDPSPSSPPESSNSSKEMEEENCCVRCGRFLYSHMLELFILVAFCASIPVGIVLQATAFHSSTSFQKYYIFWGSTMLPAVLSTITPLLIVSSMLTGMANLTANVLKRLTIFSGLYFILSTTVAVSVAVTFSFFIKPGSSGSLFNSSKYENGRFRWHNASSTAGNAFLKDDGSSLYALNEENLFYNTSEVEDITASDEILTLFRFFFPGCGNPATEVSGICNVFALALFAGIIGVGASIMGMEGAPIRHVLSQVGTTMSNMADILLWYVPVGVFFYTSEMVATRVDWANIGYDRPSYSSFGGNSTVDVDDVRALGDATKWYFVTVVTSLGLYSLVLVPLIVSLATLSNPFSLLGFRSVAPLVTATSVGFSDISVPVTLRCLLRRKGVSRCCTPREKIDRRIARVSAVLGGIFHRGGSCILVVCTALFLLQLQNKPTAVGDVILICASAMITSVTSLGGRWFYGTDPFMRAIAITLSTTGLSSSLTIPRTVLCLWLISRLAAFADTIIDLLGAQLLHRACKSHLRDVSVEKDCSRDGRCTDSINMDNKVCEMASPVNKIAAARSTSGETSDYEEAPLLFSRLLTASVLGAPGSRPDYTVVQYDKNGNPLPVSSVGH